MLPGARNREAPLVLMPSGAGDREVVPPGARDRDLLARLLLMPPGACEREVLLPMGPPLLRAASILAPGVLASAAMLCFENSPLLALKLGHGVTSLLALKVAERVTQPPNAALAALSVLTVGSLAAKGSLALVVGSLAAMGSSALLVNSLTAVLPMAVDPRAAVAVAFLVVPLPPNSALEALSVSAQCLRVPQAEMVPATPAAQPVASPRDAVVFCKETPWWEPWWCWWPLDETPWILPRVPVVPERSSL